MGDVIVKPLFGSMGLGMVRVHDEEIAWRVFRALDAIRGVYYLQRTIDHGGRDIRAFVAGDHVVGAIERRSADGGPQWRTNYSRGGAVRPLALSPEWTELAVRAARAVGADYAGVDLLPAEDGTVYALEVNAIPGWRGFAGSNRHRRGGRNRAAGPWLLNQSPRPRSSRACSRRVRRNRGTCRRAATFTTPATRISSPAPRPSGQ